MSAESSSGGPSRPPRRLSDLVWSFGLAYALCLALVAVPIYLAGVGDILANTRMMEVLINAGVIQYHDMDLGAIEGVGELENYLKSLDPVDWRIIIVCFGIFLGFHFLKSVQFHMLARFWGAQGTFGDHARAYHYGQGLNRLLPYNVGDVGVVSALEGQGVPRARATSTVYAQDLFVCMEILFFFAVGLLLVGWTSAIKETFFAVCFFGALYFMIRPHRPRPADGASDGPDWRRALGALAKRPTLLLSLCLLSLVAFLIEDITPYLVSQAFTSEFVILNVSIFVIHAGVVAGYIASRIPITPGGIGQFEFGFGTALVFAGSDMNAALTIVILTGIIRHSTAFLLFGIVMLGPGVETTLRRVLSLYSSGLETEPELEPVEALA